MTERPGRLCFVVHGYYPVGEPRLQRAAAAAVAAGWNVELVAMRRRGERPRELVDAVAVRRLPIRHRRGVGFVGLAVEYVAFTVVAAAVVAVRAMRRRYDVVHVSNPPDFLALAGILPKLRGAQLVFDVHDLSVDMFSMRFASDGRRARLAVALLERLQRWALNTADAVITVHAPYRRALEQAGCDPRKLEIVMNSTDDRVLPRARDPHRPPFRVVYHGTITPHFGVATLVRAAALARERVQDLQLEIYGEGDAIPYVESLIDELSLGESARVSARHLPIEDVLARIAGAWAGVVPNLPTALNRYALSSKLFEYVALGIPAIVADLETFREHFDDSEVVYFRSGDAHDLARALVWIAESPDAARAQAEAARRRANEYAWPAQAARYVALLESARSRSPLRPD